MSNIHLYLVNLYLMIKGVVEAAAVEGVRVCVYGPLAKLVYGHVRKGSRPGCDPARGQGFESHSHARPPASVCIERTLRRFVNLTSPSP